MPDDGEKEENDKPSYGTHDTALRRSNTEQLQTEMFWRSLQIFAKEETNSIYVWV